MKIHHILCLFVFTAFLPLSISAQSNKEDVIYLKNGSIYRGTIVDQVYGVSYRIAVAGDSVREFLAGDILKITKEEKVSVPISDSASHAGHADESKETTKADKEELIMWRKHHYNGGEGNWQVGVETDLSYILYMDGTASYHNMPANYHFNISSGAGISLLPEFRRGEHFSILSGITVQYISISRYDFYHQSDEEDPNYWGTIEKGSQVRFQIPLWFRFTYGEKIPGFFQVGWGVGGDFYQGRGSFTEGPYYSSAGYTTTGWQQNGQGFMNLLALAGGIRKEIKPGIEFITFIEISATNVQFNSLHTYQPYAQLYAGFNFNPKRGHKDK